MCRMALVIGEKGMELHTFELAMKSAWSYSNDDGCGIYWRDSKKSERHLARFIATHQLTRIPDNYDRLAIHFRKSTKGEGTHPFMCRCRPDLKSEEWILFHNGAVSDFDARAFLERPIESMKGKTITGAHTFATNIDSEPFIHAWGEIEEADLLKRAKAFTKKVNEMKIEGWANLIFYNVVTDEFVVFVDNAMHILQSKSRKVLVFASDTAWLDFTISEKAGVEDHDMKQGVVLYGKGLEVCAAKKVWKIKPRQAVYTVVSSGDSDYDAAWYGGNGSINLPATTKPVNTKGQLVLITNAADNYFTKYKDDDGNSINRSPLGNEPIITDHYFRRSPRKDPDTNDYYCLTCGMIPEFHDLDHEDLADMIEDDEETPKRKAPKVSESTRRAALEQDTTLKQLGKNHTLLKWPGCPCIPQDKKDDATGICQMHYIQGFRSFVKHSDGWYLVKSNDYRANGTMTFTRVGQGGL